MISKTLFFLFFISCLSITIQAQVDSTNTIFGDSIYSETVDGDTALRIINLNPYFSLHVDSSLSYPFQINREASAYFWFLKGAPVGLSINKDNGLLSFKANKAYFLSGRLKYDYPYRVAIGVQNLIHPAERVDSFFTILFYNTEVIPSRLKPSISGNLTIEEGETVSFKVQCETGSFPVQEILFSSNLVIRNFSSVTSCGDEFKWTPPYDFVKETDSARVKILNLGFIASTKFKVQDTTIVRIIVKDALDYPKAKLEFDQLRNTIKTYILQLKFAFLQLDKKLKNVKSTRTTIDLASGTTALAGTILNTSSSESAQRTGKVLPSVGVALVPVKEAVAPNKLVEQNQAALIRTSIKRLDYLVNENLLIGDKDPDVLKKTAKLRDELKQVQIQLIDIPVELTSTMSEEELNKYFNSPKVNKKYRLKKR